MEEDRILKKKQRAKRDGNIQHLAEAIKELADLYFENGRLEDALQEYLEQLETCELLNDKLNCAIAHRMIGEVYANLGNYEEALIHQNLYLEGAKEVKNLLEEQRAFATLGRTYFCFAETLTVECDRRNEALTNAKKAYVKSIRLCNELENSDIKLQEMMMMRTRLLLNLGLVLEAQQEFQEALELVEKAAVLCIEHNLQDDLHRTYISLAAIYERRGKTELSLEHLDKAANVSDTTLKNEARLAKAELLLKMGLWSEARKILVSLYLIKGLTQNARNQVEKYLRTVVVLCTTENKLCSENDTRVKQRLYETLGDTAVAVQCFGKAINYYREMLKCAEDNNNEQIGPALTSLAQTLRDAEQYSEAVSVARRELQFCTNSRETCRSALFLADLLISAKASDVEIKESFNLALTNAHQCTDTALQISVMKEFLFYLENINHFDEAKEIKIKLDAIKETLNDTENESENESEVESLVIGADICLEDLSDVENEMNAIKKVGTVRNRYKRGFVIKRNEKGETQLHVACINGNIENVQKLLEAGHQTNVRDNCGWTPLHEAANHNHIEIAELLLKYGANVNDPGGTLCGGVTPLHDAASCGNISMIYLLIENGANLKLKTKDGDTVLSCLQGWKARTGDLSPEEQVEYEGICTKLYSVVPKNTEKRVKEDTFHENHYNKLIDVDIDHDELQPKRISAGEDYKRTIAGLKHKNSLIAPITNQKPQKITPLLDNEEVLIDNWLEDDIGVNVKKKAANDNLSTSKRKFDSSKVNSDKEYVQIKRKKTDTEIEKKEQNIFINESSTDSDISEVFNRPIRKKQTHQLSLLSSGFTKDSISCISSPVSITSFSNSFQQTATDTTTTANTTTTQILNINIYVKEKLYNLKLKYLEEGTELIHTILHDIKNRFYNDTGCTIEIILKTMTGDSLSSENIFDTIKNDNSKNLKCEIVKIEIPPIIDRYRYICKICEIAVQEVMIKCLKSCENTSVFRLKSDETNDEEITVLLKVLEYQKNIHVLHLSGGNLFNAGILLNDCLSNLSVLQELYLQRCDISYYNLMKLKKLPLQLRVLDLSYNRLGSECEEVLSELIVPLKYLQTLNLRHCELKSFCIPFDNNSNLVNLDISWNSLEGDDTCLLQRELLNLNLSNTIHPTRLSFVTSIMTNSMFIFTTLESLELACCDISDYDVKNILLQAPNLSKFILTGNPRVSAISVNMLLNRTPTLSYIDVSACVSIADLPDSTTSIKNPETCTLIISMQPNICENWLSLWKGKGIVHKLPHNLTLFKPL